LKTTSDQYYSEYGKKPDNMSREQNYYHRIKQLLEQGTRSLSLYDIDPKAYFLSGCDYDENIGDLEDAFHEAIYILDEFVETILRNVIDDYNLEIYTKSDTLPTTFSLRDKNRDHEVVNSYAPRI
jgi:hypothetical protein